MHCSEHSSKAAAPHRAWCALGASLLIVALAGCGGGDSTPARAPAQGFYAGSAGTGRTAQAVLLPQGELWLVVTGSDGSVLAARGEATVQDATLSATGSATNVATLGTAPFSLQASAQADSTAITGTLQIGGTNSNIEWTYDSRYETVRPVADSSGQWSGSSSAGAVTLTWDVGSGGALTGSSTAGCTYSGALASEPQPSAVLAVSVTETCAGAPPTALAGIATLNTTKDRMTIVISGAGRVGLIDFHR